MRHPDWFMDWLMDNLGWVIVAIFVAIAALHAHTRDTRARLVWCSANAVTMSQDQYLDCKRDAYANDKENQQQQQQGLPQ